ncbi:hypothetical protein H257_15403 [Aphanomyces astaci]|uniref:Reverse transcriptase domain-containing protein n=1 Tax=Aphanomyces astaci TaxID=112090 RepID=W4FMX3_APHAT|nr:hypothetical protein H257_15403 [Aphanomyces astaci]ETV68862.1 hypothetical protein H257_15403 [Aphanomyces astaci]|eukprot:XP_009841816.1 hypothetical protein H257_15403 [Aphanomyces astaci]
MEEVWDFVDQPYMTPGVATLRMEELSDDIDEEKGMCCATPELGTTPSLADTETVRIVLMAKAAAPRIFLKKDLGDLWMTIDFMGPINAFTETMPWPLPNLDVAMGVLKNSRVYFTLAWMKGYWQLTLHPNSQKYYSFMTPGVGKPTRVLTG